LIKQEEVTKLNEEKPIAEEKMRETKRLFEEVSK